MTWRVGKCWDCTQIASVSDNLSPFFRSDHCPRPRGQSVVKDFISRSLTEEQRAIEEDRAAIARYVDESAAMKAEARPRTREMFASDAARMCKRVICRSHSRSRLGGPLPVRSRAAR